jgi:carbonic anhydrase/acetyltransferase-like protein (isoleucine patch superfamily)
MEKPRVVRFGEAWVADNATVLGDVTLGRDANIWFGCVLRGDIAPIVVGARTNIQDLTTGHVDPGVTNVIGEEVMIGHRAVIHGARVGDGALIGMGAVLLARSEIGEGAVVGAGSVVREGAAIPPGHLAVGAPARVVREVTAEEAAFIAQSTLEYVERAKAYAAGRTR